MRKRTALISSLIGGVTLVMSVALFSEKPTPDHRDVVPIEKQISSQPSSISFPDSLFRPARRSKTTKSATALVHSYSIVNLDAVAGLINDIARVDWDSGVRALIHLQRRIIALTPDERKELLVETLRSDRLDCSALVTYILASTKGIGGMKLIASTLNDVDDFKLLNHIMTFANYIPIEPGTMSENELMAVWTNNLFWGEEESLGTIIGMDTSLENSPEYITMIFSTWVMDSAIGEVIRTKFPQFTIQQKWEILANFSSGTKNEKNIELYDDLLESTANNPNLDSDIAPSAIRRSLFRLIRFSSHEDSQRLALKWLRKGSEVDKATILPELPFIKVELEQFDQLLIDLSRQPKFATGALSTVFTQRRFDALNSILRTSEQEQLTFALSMINSEFQRANPGATLPNSTANIVQSFQSHPKPAIRDLAGKIVMIDRERSKK